MLERGEGNLLDAKVDALVNAVNTVGVMGKGLALQFKQAFPETFAPYVHACETGALSIGRVHVVRRTSPPRFIIHFPTKAHWREPSRLEYIRDGLTSLVAVVREQGIGSLALPVLGCGLGGLDWADVKPRVERAFADLPDVRVVVFEPGGPQAPAKQSRRRGPTRKP
nr:macro domain-containing protein [Myxococcus sp. MH1]